MSAIESILGVPGGTFGDQAVSGSRSFKLSPSMPRPEVGFSEFGVRGKLAPWWMQRSYVCSSIKKKIGRCLRFSPKRRTCGAGRKTCLRRRGRCWVDGTIGRWMGGKGREDRGEVKKLEAREISWHGEGLDTTHTPHRDWKMRLGCLCGGRKKKKMGRCRRAASSTARPLDVAQWLLTCCGATSGMR